MTSGMDLSSPLVELSRTFANPLRQLFGVLAIDNLYPRRGARHVA
jgi:hypothetical protein